MIGYLYDEIHPYSMIEIPAGMSISGAAQNALDVAAVTGRCYGFFFNTILITVSPKDSVREVCCRYDDGMKNLRAVRR